MRSRSRSGFALVVATTLATAGLAVSTAPAASAASAPSPATMFLFTDFEQTYTVPAGVTKLHVIVVGAPGGADDNDQLGGQGEVAAADVPVTPGQTLYVEVGGPGDEGSPYAGGGGDGKGGFNGGGDGGVGVGGFVGGGGGGSTDVRTVSAATSGTLASRLVVAGGGGGAGNTTQLEDFGPKGGDAGASGIPSPYDTCSAQTQGCGGEGATLIGPGQGGHVLGTNEGSQYGANGTAPRGGDGSGNTSGGGGGGGGGGLFGGGGGAGGDIQATGSAGGGGGGGSSGFGQAAANTSTGLDTTGVPSVTLTPYFPLTVSTSGHGSGSVTGTGISCGKNCTGSYLATATETLRAVAAKGSVFTAWSGACRGHGTCHVAMTSAKAVHAAFALAPPTTTLTRAHISRTARSASFVFTGSGHVTGFECSLEKHRHHAVFKECSSAKKYRHLARGSYLFEVRAKGSGGVDATPAKRSFRI